MKTLTYHFEGLAACRGTAYAVEMAERKLKIFEMDGMRFSRSPRRQAQVRELLQFIKANKGK